VCSGELATIRVGPTHQMRVPISALASQLGEVSIMSVRDTAATLGLCYESVRSMVARDVLPHLRKGRNIYILRPDKAEAQKSVIERYRALKQSENPPDRTLSNTTVNQPSN
jgi:hypothetical protein